MPFIKGVYYVHLTQYIKRFREKLSDENLTLEELFNGLDRIGVSHAIIDGNESNLYLGSDLNGVLNNRIYTLGLEIERYRKERDDRLQIAAIPVIKQPKPKPLTQTQRTQIARDNMYRKRELDAEDAENKRKRDNEERMKKLSDLYLASDGVFGKPYGDPYDDLDESMKTKKFRRW